MDLVKNRGHKKHLKNGTLERIAFQRRAESFSEFRILGQLSTEEGSHRWRFEKNEEEDDRVGWRNRIKFQRPPNAKPNCLASQF